MHVFFFQSKSQSSFGIRDERNACSSKTSIFMPRTSKFLGIHPTSSLKVLIHFHLGFGSKYTMGCISENSLLYIRCMCRHLAIHLVPRNLIFFNSYRESFPSKTVSVLSCSTWEFLLFWASSLTHEHRLGETLLSALGLVGVQQMGILIKHEAWGACRPKEVSWEAAS